MGSFAYDESKSKSRSQSQDSVWGEQSPYLKDLYGQAQAQSQRTPEQSVAGFNPMQTQGFNMARDYATGGGQDIYGNTANALNFGLNAADVNQNPYFQKAMQSAIRPITQNFQENVLSGGEDQALAAGQYGSSRHGVSDALAKRDYMNTIGDVTANMGSQAYGQGLNTMMQSLGQAGNVQNMGLFGSNVLQNIGGQRQGMTQAMMDAPWNNISRYQQAIGGPVKLGTSGSSGDASSWGTSGSFGGGG